jgi:hypothetical protein
MSAPSDVFFVLARSHDGSRVEMPLLGSESDLDLTTMTDDDSLSNQRVRD